MNFLELLFPFKAYFQEKEMIYQLFGASLFGTFSVLSSLNNNLYYLVPYLIGGIIFIYRVKNKKFK